jgi:hypothetical protein
MSRRAAAWLAWSLWLFGMAIGLLGHLLDTSNGYVNSPPVIGDLAGAASLTVGAMIVSRRPANRIGWLFLLSTLLLAFGGAGNLAEQYAIFTLVAHPGMLPGGAWMVWLGMIAQIAGFVPLVSFLLLLFPDGQLVSPRWRPVAWAAAGYVALIVLVEVFDPMPATAHGLQAPNPLGLNIVLSLPAPLREFSSYGSSAILISGLGIALACIASVYVRFQRARGDERQQLKWFAFGALLIPFTVLIGLLAILLNWAWLQNLGLWQLSVAGVPLATGIAILKYRLYDIDLIIRRTLVYSLLTTVLALVYFGSVVGLQALFTALTGQQRSELVTVLSTLAIAALFVPLRNWLQAAIDRRFYRRRYDTARTLAAFSSSVRDEVELGRLTERLTKVVDETLQPETVTLWLKGQPAPLRAGAPSPPGSPVETYGTQVLL